MNNPMKKKYFHPFHLVDASPWPIVSSLAILALVLSSVLIMQGTEYATFLFVGSILSVLGSLLFWFKDIVYEGSYEGYHTNKVVKGLYIGMLLFIISEVFFFFSIFWAYFHSTFSPSVEIGDQWPPRGFEVINPWGLPLLNTVILLSSGSTVTYAHHSLISGNRRGALIGMFLTIVLALVFTTIQGMEYFESSFTISDGIYGSCFYFGTGFHGFHVLIGTIFLIIGLYRIWNYHLTTDHYFGLEAGILYWHFVDVVWLFLFMAVYWWGS
uniref:Cytochrome c oxidase subunit 3 n=1 Tax=Pneumocystis wakefieldiae TaxID=38082 RepID=A0A8A6W527_9ASCO|nr:cytochrome c oxidase subunit 3 [Pneumocystis wakefieldiae]QTK22284.1 cytochrome c oxidase subunit 3 [Pneumocystis wakefieldiae]